MYVHLFSNECGKYEIYDPFILENETDRKGLPTIKYVAPKDSVELENDIVFHKNSKKIDGDNMDYGRLH